MTAVRIQYSNFVKTRVCTECGWALNDNICNPFLFAPSVDVCPNCGGEVENAIGRWMYSVAPMSWWKNYLAGFIPETTYHGFLKGRESDTGLSKDGIWRMEADEDCDCEGCKLSNSGLGYQPCHNREKLSSPR